MLEHGENDQSASSFACDFFGYCICTTEFPLCGGKKTARTETPEPASPLMELACLACDEASPAPAKRQRMANLPSPSASPSP